MKEIGGLMRRPFSLEASFKENFIVGLSETFPDSHVCSTEAEKCIAACSDEKVFEGQVWYRIIVNNDSDTLIYTSITRVLRKMPKSSDYGLYLKDNVVAKLDLFNKPNNSIQALKSNTFSQTPEILNNPIRPRPTITPIFTRLRQLYPKVVSEIRAVCHFKGFAAAVAEWVFNHAMTDSRKIQSVMMSAVDVCGRIQVHLYYAGILWTSNNEAFAEHIFAIVLEDANFTTALARLLYFGDRFQAFKSMSSTGFLDTGRAAMAAYGFFVQKTAFKPLSQTSNLPFGDISGMIAKPVQVAFKNHYQKTSVNTDGGNMAMSDITYFFLHNGNLSPSGVQNKRLVDFPKVKLTPGFVCLNEANITNILWSNKGARAILQLILCRRLNPPGPNQSITFDTKQDLEYLQDEYRGLVMDVIFGHGDYTHVDFMRNRYRELAATDEDVPAHVPLDQGDSSNRRPSPRYWLKGSIFTDGLVIYHLAYDASITKTRRQQQQSLRQDEDDIEGNDDLDLMDSFDDDLEFDHLDADELAAVMKEADVDMDSESRYEEGDPNQPYASSSNSTLLHTTKTVRADPTPVDPGSAPTSKVLMWIQIRLQTRHGRDGRLVPGRYPTSRSNSLRLNHAPIPAKPSFLGGMQENASLP
ncbi:hypothetical protein BGZ97_008424 [Linnemannia gamsii]|uniref:Uncharacterized protein n=1 Tax=Linnemannia gamsii TaxID=64522 RepID=A0A9P6RDX8_9FUNG|nr:hypothetical protein BGZ97_008424 [Linnemannia gamsii]